MIHERQRICHSPLCLSRNWRCYYRHLILSGPFSARRVSYTVVKIDLFPIYQKKTMGKKQQFKDTDGKIQYELCCLLLKMRKEEMLMAKLWVTVLLFCIAFWCSVPFFSASVSLYLFSVSPLSPLSPPSLSLSLSLSISFTRAPSCFLFLDIFCHLNSPLSLSFFLLSSLVLSRSFFLSPSPSLRLPSCFLSYSIILPFALASFSRFSLSLSLSLLLLLLLLLMLLLCVVTVSLLL